MGKSDSASSDTTGTPIFEVTGHDHNGTFGEVQRYKLKVGEDFETQLDVKNTGNASGVFSSTIVARHFDTGIEENFSIRSEEKVEPGEEISINRTMSLGHLGDYRFFVNDDVAATVTTDVPKMKEFGESVSMDTGITVSADNLRYRDSYTYREDGEKFKEETEFYEAFILVDMVFENSGNETFKLPERWHFKWDISDPIDVRNNSDIDELDYGSNLSSGEVMKGTIVFRDSVNAEHNYPDSLLLGYEEKGLGGRWNVTEEDYFDDLGREP